MRDVVPNIYRLEDLKRSNVYLLHFGENLALIDSGMAADADQIIEEIRNSGCDPERIQAILITHAHLDHAGSAPILAEEFGVDIYAHELEAPYLQKTASLPYQSWLKKAIFWLGERTVMKSPPCPVDQQLRDGDVIEDLSGLQVIHTPGHTPGSMSLYLPESKVIFCGDLLFNMHPVTGKRGLRLSIPLVTVDKTQVLHSVRRLASMDVEKLCAGHGEPIMRRAGEELRKLLPEGPE
ncbi:MAG TPA: MBL fold metallo-hydrolase [bacterium]|nr:MBL fold metallo-hydrolase [bacterium]